MTSAVQSPEDVINLALTRTGYPMRVMNIYDGTDAATAALNIYTQTLNELLRDGDWHFAQRAITLTLLKQAPDGGYFPPTTWNGNDYPPPQWLFEYAYPDDCLKVRTVRPQNYFVLDFDPQPYLWVLANDNFYSPSRRVILSNAVSAMMIYVGQVGDPTLWDANFIEALAAEIGRRLGPVLVGMDAVKLEAADAQVQKMTAAENQG